MFGGGSGSGNGVTDYRDKKDSLEYSLKEMSQGPDTQMKSYRQSVAAKKEGLFHRNKVPARIQP